RSIWLSHMKTAELPNSFENVMAPASVRTIQVLRAARARQIRVSPPQGRPNQNGVFGWPLRRLRKKVSVDLVATGSSECSVTGGVCNTFRDTNPFTVSHVDCDGAKPSP